MTPTPRTISDAAKRILGLPTGSGSTITAGELRKKHLLEREVLIPGGRTGTRIHKGWDSQVLSRAKPPTQVYPMCGSRNSGAVAALPSPAERKIEYSRLCRHPACFR